LLFLYIQYINLLVIMPTSYSFMKKTTDITQAVTDAFRLLKILPKPNTIAIALSGGADSMALALLTQEWAKKDKIQMVTLTVDHRLRKESSKEAKRVASWMKKRGIPHHILTLSKKLPVGNRQAAAREARYAELIQWCHAHNIHHLLLGHHQDDQAETFLLRLARGSGVDGLACMSAMSELQGITLLRPLLDIPKSSLIAYLKRKKQPWAEDPSNQSLAYERNRIRQMRVAIGISSERLAGTASRMRHAREALEYYTEQLLEKAAHRSRQGHLELQAQQLLAAPRDVGLRALAQLLCLINGEIYKPRLDDLTRLYNALADKNWKGSTLAGVQLIPKKNDTVWLVKEKRAQSRAKAS